MNDFVLVVDDEADIREGLREVLEGQGYRVDTAENGRRAMEILEHCEAAPCFVLLDLRMPEMDGWEFLRRVEAEPRLRDLPIVISTSAPEAAPEGREVIPKPIDLRELLGRVRRASRRGTST